MQIEFRDFLADRLGTREWVVAPRLTERLKSLGYDRAVPQKRFTALRQEYLASRVVDPWMPAGVTLPAPVMAVEAIDPWAAA